MSVRPAQRYAWGSNLSTVGTTDVSGEHEVLLENRRAGMTWWQSVRPAKISVISYQKTRRRPLRTVQNATFFSFREKWNCQPPFRYIRFYLQVATQFHARASAQCGLLCNNAHRNSKVEQNFVKISLSRLQLNSENNLKNTFISPFTGLGGVR